MNRIMEATKGLVHRNIKDDMKDYFNFDGWFASKRPAKAVMDVGDDMIGIV